MEVPIQLKHIILYTLVLCAVEFCVNLTMVWIVCHWVNLMQKYFTKGMDVYATCRVLEGRMNPLTSQDMSNAHKECNTCVNVNINIYNCRLCMVFLLILASMNINLMSLDVLNVLTTYICVNMTCVLQ